MCLSHASPRVARPVLASPVRRRLRCAQAMPDTLRPDGLRVAAPRVARQVVACQAVARASRAKAGAGGGARTRTAFARGIFLPATAFAASPRAYALGRLWSGLYLHLGAFAPLGAARLVSTPSHQPLAGRLARDCHVTGFPEFEQFYCLRFPQEHSNSFKSLASTSSATSALVSRDQILSAFSGEVELG